MFSFEERYSWRFLLVSAVLHAGVFGLMSLVLVEKPHFGLLRGEGGESAFREHEVTVEVDYEEPELSILPEEKEPDLIVEEKQVPLEKKKQPEPKPPVRRAGPEKAGKQGAQTRNITAAEYRRNPISYPPEGRRKKLEGLVLLKVWVNTKGGVDDLSVIKSSGYHILDEWALKTVRKWKFDPARSKIGNIPVAQDVKVPVNFQLK